MPEGPSIVILKEAVAQFKGKKILEVSGNTKTELPPLKNLVVKDFKSWGKHFIICFKKFSIRIHFLLFGTYRINEQKTATPRLHFRFSNGELNFYTCSIQLINDIDGFYDWRADVMNPVWSASSARKKLSLDPAMMICDALLDQQIFSGVGNIIKNEVLFRIHVHPESRVGAMPPGKISAVLKEAVKYSFEFLKWKKEFTLKKNWLIYNRKTCPRDHIPFIKKNTGKTNRKTFYCSTCQKLYI